MNIDTAKISRVTLVDENGRVYERWNLDVILSIQDDGRTLKVFASPKVKPEAVVENADRSS